MLDTVSRNLDRPNFFLPGLLERRLVQRRRRCRRSFGRRVDLEQRRRRRPRGARLRPRRPGPLPQRGQRRGELGEEALLGRK